MRTIGQRLTFVALVVAVSLADGGRSAAGAERQITPENIVALGTAAHDIVVRDDLAYVATDAGLMILRIDPTDRTSMLVLGSAATSGSGKSLGIEVVGDYAYLASQGAGLQVFDVSHPDTPVLVAARKVSGAAWDVAVKDHIAYVVSFGGEMYLFDISNPENPVANKKIAGFPRKVPVLGLPAWGSPAGDATNLAKLNNYVASGGAKATGVSVAGNHLFATDWNYGRIYYYDVTEADQPLFRGTHYAPFILRVEADPARDVVYMLSAYAASSGIYTVPISALGPTYSTRHSTCAECGYRKSNYGIDQGGLGIVPGGRHIFYAGGKVGEFHIVDVTEHSLMENVASAKIGPHRVSLAQTMGLQASGDYLYFAAGATGIQVFKYAGLSAPAP